MHFLVLCCCSCCCLCCCCCCKCITRGHVIFFFFFFFFFGVCVCVRVHVRVRVFMLSCLSLSLFMSHLCTYFCFNYLTCVITWEQSESSSCCIDFMSLSCFFFVHIFFIVFLLFSCIPSYFSSVTFVSQSVSQLVSAFTNII